MINKCYIYFFFTLFSLGNLSAQTNNIDFELTPAGAYTTANAVSGWTVSSQTNSSIPTSSIWAPGSPEFSIVSTPIPAFPFIGNIQHSPLGGTNVGRLNNSTANYSSTKLSRDYFVTSSNSLLQYAYAGVWQSDNYVQPWHVPSFFLRIRDQSGTELSCLSLSMAASFSGSYAGVTYSISPQTSTTISLVFWTNWQIKTIDLSPYVNSTITIEVISNDCVFGDHYGTVFFDADLPVTLPIVNYCTGSPSATLTAPPGYYSYDWWIVGSGPGFQQFFPAYTRTLAFNVGSSSFTYSILANSYYSQCSYTVSGTVVSTPTNIYQIKSKPSCPSGTSGSATVIANAATSYNWINSTNSVVSTSSVANNLAPGTYTVHVNGCGSASGTVNIPTSTLTLNTILKPYCGSESILSYPGGSNYQWYYNSAPITASLGGTASSYTVTTPIGQPTYVVSYDAPNGCRDSVQTILTAATLGSISVLTNATVCPNSSNGIAVVSLVPSSDSPFGPNSYSVFSTGTTPAYTSTLFPTSLNSFTASGLTAGGTYSVNVFDGVCKYGSSFSVTPVSFNYNLSVGSATLCPGNSVNAFVIFSPAALPQQYTYSWSPSTFLTSTTTQGNIINPFTALGTSTTITYTVVVTPTLANCPLTKTLSITAANPVTPTISAIPQLCSNAPPYSITVNPTGGVFTNGGSSAIGNISGILNPSLSNPGVNTFTYSNSIGNCVAKSSASYTVNPAPAITVSGNTLTCEGQPVTLLASGANSYTWSNSSLSPFITVNPSVTISYSVEGKDALTNCSNLKTITITVDPYPVLSILGNTLLCLGNTTTLTANGASSYSWSNGFNSQAITVSPNLASTYSLVGTSALASCSSTQAITINVELCNFTNILERNSTKNLIVYPNPTTGKFFIEAENISSVVITDELGKIILEDHFQKENYQLDLSKVQNGIYILKVFHNNQIKTIKLVKND